MLRGHLAPNENSNREFSYPKLSQGSGATPTRRASVILQWTTYPTFSIRSPPLRIWQLTLPRLKRLRRAGDCHVSKSDSSKHCSSWQPFLPLPLPSESSAFLLLSHPASLLTFR